MRAQRGSEEVVVPVFVECSQEVIDDFISLLGIGARAGWMQAWFRGGRCRGVVQS